ncbi:Undecaprenyl pyrophosphate synthetase [Methanosarcina thermophila]|jgi:tritrans,polycis-undecaprenyl-diphosphate synthase [geranylgeranyl-diphosphate specific]|uniref:Tritrans,polycis-undecaprenyl-diphosphate synthase (geranylgeranyl-diphosphate specific) n=1 Tax=Methanosarcina thermophila TaxID=2210 RepID=A0A1I7BAT2_METTE|nr:polyprenyl diphosphate synthase [Methanosarcina thermophila]ALK05361.1 MAG: UDP pyrophosphate synthase [Methanosarcina sp. 795]NLU58277.1 di-trans,poly-cis-decaprenylcistransferase [Methanosarcina thermophila]SFT84293.1 Undecaprenyl pyrophosphate synthetase [Methanosarcina thermophila]HOA70196.1 polyprenyl diphosphate synthase [Methanosarcina thermophila]HPZ21331.1 polyprenyl diphosphate synthase [Methanosarcina thermophila]
MSWNRGILRAGLRFLRDRVFSVFYREYEKRLEMEILNSEIPHHVAVIMDGNRRYAGQLGKTRSYGHAMGAEVTEKVIEWCYEIGIKQLTLYAFSTENFQRSEEEVDGLFNLINEKFLKLYSDPRTHEQEIQVRVIGDRSKLPAFLNESIEKTEKATENYRKFHLNVAIAYGGRQDIIQAVRDIASCISNGKLSLEEVDENLISKHLYPAPGVSVPNVDLIIRTGGDERISNFLPWQANGSECAAYFCAPFWPEFRKIDLLRSIRVYQARKAERKLEQSYRASKVVNFLKIGNRGEKFEEIGQLQSVKRQGIS